jgi:energy-coupling factor transporter ATP-binding protein EcfA2
MSILDLMGARKAALREWGEKNIKVVEIEKPVDSDPFINFLRSMIFVIIGRRGSGKSSFLAYLGQVAYEEQATVFDSFGAEDYENCFWVVKEKKAYPCIFIVPPYVDVDLPDAYKELIKVMPDTCALEDIMKAAHDEKRVIVFVNSAYHKDDRPRMFDLLAGYYKDIEGINERLGYNIFIMAREMRQISQGAGKVKLHENAEKTKSSLILLSTTCRHHRISLGLDGQFFNQSDAEIVDHYDRIAIKCGPSFKIPDKLQAYSSVSHGLKKVCDIIAESGWKPVEKLEPKEYYQLYDSGELYKKTFPLPKFHIKREGEFFQLMTGIKFAVNEERYKTQFSPETEAAPKINPSDTLIYNQYMRLKTTPREGKPWKAKEILEIIDPQGARWKSTGAFQMWLSNYRRSAGIKVDFNGAEVEESPEPEERSISDMILGPGLGLTPTPNTP